MPIIKNLSILLSLSLGANFWFVWYIYSDNVITTTALQQNQNEKAKDSEAIAPLPNNQWIPLTQDTNTLNEKAGHTKTLRRAQHDRVALNQLKELARNQEYTILEYEISRYLRQYPRDIDALLLEAETYLHTKPLNIAIIQYNSLLSQPLSPEQRNQVLKVIEVNTTRIIQQFSGDGAWNLLAEFLEPLVQIDPLNKTYLLSLAKAYGMQNQIGLMENTLASILPTDPRAIRLRNGVLTHLDKNNTPPSTQTTPLDNEFENHSESADLILVKQSGHFIAQTRISDQKANLLLDTGASTTAISDLKFNQLKQTDIEFLGLFTVNTAGGELQAPIYKIRTLSLGKQILNNISVLVLPAENLVNYDGLLGMNVLSQFDMSFDANSQTMRMYRK